MKQLLITSRITFPYILLISGQFKKSCLTLNLQFSMELLLVQYKYYQTSFYAITINYEFYNLKGYLFFFFKRETKIF